jgi:hypothetical protein
MGRPRLPFEDDFQRRVEQQIKPEFWNNVSALK